MKTFKYTELSDNAKLQVRLELFDHVKQSELDFNWDPLVYDVETLENLITREEKTYEFDGEESYETDVHD